MIDEPLNASGIELRIPANPSLARTLCVAAGGVATLDGSTVIDLNVMAAVSEVFLALIDHGRGDPIDMSMWVDGRAFNLRGGTTVGETGPPGPDLASTRTALSMVADIHQLGVTDNQAVIWASVPF
jgi:hypothetical protein